MEAIMGGDGLSPYNPGVWPGIPEMIPLEYHCDVSAFGERSFLWYIHVVFLPMDTDFTNQVSAHYLLRCL